MSEMRNNEIESLLRARFEGPVRDDGFSARVMQRLPHHRRRSGWWRWAGLLVGAGACWLTLLWSPLLDVGWQDWLHGEWSGTAITMALAACGLTVLMAAWGTAEAADG